jgi:uncharacterized repeat protein (TIGR01451 family)
VWNKAYVSGGTEINAVNDTSRIYTPVLAPDMTISKVANGTFNELQNATYTLTVTNSGTSVTTANVVVTDTLRAGLSFVSGVGTGWAVNAVGQVVTATYSGAALAIGATSSFTLTVAITAAAYPSVNNRAWVSGGGQVETTNDSSTLVNTPIGAATPHLTLLKSVTDNGNNVGGGSVLPGRVLTYTITFLNGGTGAATNVVITDNVPAQLRFKVGSATSSLPAGVTATIEYFSSGSWTYTPVSGGCGAPTGYDNCVTQLRWNLQQPLAAGASGTVTLDGMVK